jgi:hypothetical protein
MHFTPFTQGAIELTLMKPKNKLLDGAITFFAGPNESVLQ